MNHVKLSEKNIGVFLLTGLLCLGGAGLLQGGIEGQNVPTRTIRFPWNNGDHEVGLYSGEEVENQGPLTFCLEPDGGILFLDSVEKCVKRTHLTSGTLSVAATGVTGSAICSDRSGGFYCRNEGRLEHFGGQGKRMASRSIGLSNPGPEGYGIELNWNGAGQTVLQLLDQTSVPISTSTNASESVGSGTNTTGSQGRLKGRMIQTSSSSAPLRFYIKRFDGGRARILGEDESGEVRVDIPLKLDQGRIGAAIFKGSDAVGNLYVELERIEDGGAVGLEVHRYGMNGVRLFVFDLPNHYYTTVYKKTEVAPDGAVIQMYTTPQGTEFREYGP